VADEFPGQDAGVDRVHKGMRIRHFARLGVWLLTCLLGPLLVNAQTVTLNLRDADIHALINTVSEVTGKNFVVDPSVKGKVTVVSAHPLRRDEIYQVFLSVLKVHGYVAVPSGTAVKIVPQASGRADSITTEPNGKRGAGDEMITRVLTIEHVPVQQLVPVLRPLVLQQGHMAAYAPSNALIISDTAANIRRLATIIQRIDVPAATGVEVIPLEHASAPEVLRILEGLQLTSGETGSPLSSKLVADERTNSVLISGRPPTRLRLRAVIAHLDTPPEGGGNTDVVYLRYSEAKDLIPVLEGVIRSMTNDSGEQAASSHNATASVQADEAVNALVITASPAVLKNLMAVIRKLDVRRAQVLVEAVIAEVTAERVAELGIQWRTPTKPGEQGIFGGTDFSGGSNSINQFARNPLNAAAGLALGYIDGTILFGGQELLNIKALIRALASDATTNILSTPTLVTLDNEEAEITVAENVPFITGQFTVNAGTGDSVTNPFQTIERRDVGLILKLTPQINEGDALKMVIEQELSRVIPSAAPSGAGSVGAVDLITNVRSIKTTVMVDHGKMLVLGGLIDDDVVQSNQKVPLLGDIPMLGRLFRFDSTEKRKRNLLIFLRPLILRDQLGAQISSAKYNYLRAVQLHERARGIELMPGEAPPLLPPLAEYLRAPFGFAPSIEKGGAKTPGARLEGE
jgi:general secretion pathway protein D